MKFIYSLFFAFVFTWATGCISSSKRIAPDAIKPVAITERVVYDTDDPAIWIHPTDKSKSLVVGTDKETNGGLYVYDLSGKIVTKKTGMQRPNNVDIAYGFKLGNKNYDLAITTERERNAVRFFSMPDLQPMDGDTGFAVFEGEALRDPMGIAVYKRPADGALFVIVGRKNGTDGSYLWQYQLKDRNGKLDWELVRKFGNFSNKKEIEALAVDNELGYVYCSDEQFGIRKYYADPAKGNEEIALFGMQDFKEDMEGISIYKKDGKTGYILISDQQANSFNIYAREGSSGNPHHHVLLARVPVSTISSDGSEVTSLPLNDRYPKGFFVAMSEGKVFHYYDWRDIMRYAGLD